MFKEFGITSIGFTGAPRSGGVEKLVLRLAQGEGGARCSAAVAWTTVRAAQTSPEYVTDLQVVE